MDYQFRKYGYLKKYVNVMKANKKNAQQWSDWLPVADTYPNNMNTMFRVGTVNATAGEIIGNVKSTWYLEYKCPNF